MRSDVLYGLLRGTALATLALLTACAASQPATPKRAYLLEAARTADQTVVAHPGLLYVASLRVAEPFAGKGMVYRFDEYRYESDYYHQYFVAPRDMVTQRVFEWLQSAGVYESVRLAAGSSRRGGVTLDGLVTQMYGDLRDAQRPSAVLAVQFYLMSEKGQVLFTTQLRSIKTVADSSAESLARGLSEALVVILTDLEVQLRTAVLAPVTRTSTAETRGSQASASAQ